MEYRKNDEVTVVITDMGENGEGIGKADGFPLFIKDAVIGDRVRAKIIKWKKTYGYGKLLEILEPSPDRVAPRCPVAVPCGGCQLQAMSYEAQLRYKQNKVKAHLERIGHFAGVEVLPVLGMEEPWHYRNKSQLPVGLSRDGKVAMGFYAGRTHTIIETEHCFIGYEGNEEIEKRIRTYMECYGVEPYDEERHTGLIRHVLIRRGFRTGQLMVCLVINGKMLPREDALVESLKEVPGMASISLSENKEKTNVILGKNIRNLYGPGYIVDEIGPVSYEISPLSFYQVNSVQTEILYETALSFAGLSGEETVWDVYCGIGTISLFLARKARKVYGVEIVPAAIENARANARRNGIQNAEFFVGKAEEVLPRQYAAGKTRADVIVVDPPRKGCEETVLSTMVQMEPDRIVYVSCDSATLARDLRYLCDRGYEIRKVQPVDMFPMTGHVETVCLLSRNK